ncbi:MAG TPA: phage major capsid protein [Bavariicoccus seileri]|uniref:Phage major capsid protein n=1 Tax=Bavariicoccus seileri TaxID=549685 RepID=A0A3D4S3C6_9ENTE|nr:phage major capsid protein [Bavariicoccus seileri]HCS93126.1 phage major capsid protein [Bavariicoccus seileri]
MALRKLILAKKISERSSKIEALRADEDKLKDEEKEVAKAVDEAETDEDMKVVEDSADELEKKLDENAKAIADLEKEKAELEAELADIEEDQPKAKTEEDEEKGEERQMAKKINTRDTGVMSIRESLQVDEVRSFYQNIANAMTEKRSLTGDEKVVPQIVVDRIESKLGDYSTLLAEVTVEQIGGTGRAVIAGDIPEAVWFELGKKALAELEDEFKGIEVDGFGLGGYLPVPNIIIENSLINLAAHVEDRLAKSIAKALDKAILKGEGLAKKQPIGIVPSIPEENKVESDGNVADLIAQLGLVDTDGTGGEVVAVMNRKTYYSKIVPQTLAVAANGVLTGSYALPFRVVLSAYADDNTVVFADLKQYLLSQRSAIRVESSTDVQFTSDNTVFRGVGYFDGKPMKNNAFALVTITDTPAEA